MKTAKFKYIETILRDYPKTDEYIKYRMQELMYPFNEHRDENIGGSRGSMTDFAVERMAITIADDRRLTALSNNKKTIDLCLYRSDNITQKLIKGMYFTNDYPTIQSAALDISMSCSQLRRRKNEFFAMLEDELGLP